jgi:TP901 family phage tail tape measure protein
MGQYFRYAAGSTQTFGRLFKTEFDTIGRVAESRVKSLQTQYIKLGRDANGAMQAIKVRPLALDMQNLATQQAIVAQKQQLMNKLVQQGSTSLLNFGKNTQWAGRQLTVGFTVPLTMLGVAASRVFMNMEKEIVRLRRVYGDFNTTVGDTDKMVNQIKQLGLEYTKYGVAVSKTMGLAADAAAMGKTGADLIAQVANATKLAVLGGVDQQKALETTTSLTNTFGIAAKDLAGNIDFLNAVENQTITSIDDLTTAIPKAAPVIKQLGGNVKDLAFFLTAMREGGINASEGANAIKSGIASMINPTKKASEFLAGFGINVKGIVESDKGNVKNMVIDMAKAFDTLDPLNRAKAIEMMFGKFQFARISTLFQNVVAEGSQASRVLGLTKATAAELSVLSEREMKKVEDSPMYKFQKAVEDMKAKLVPLGEQFLKLLTPIIGFVTNILDKFNSLGDNTKGFIMGIIGVLGGLAPMAIMAFGLIANGIANLIKAGNFLRNVFIRAGQGTGILGQQTQYMSAEQIDAAAAAASLDQAHMSLTQQFTVEESAVRKLAAAYEAAAVAGRSLATVPGPGGKMPRGMKLADGIISVPGPKGAGDVVPAMLSPGEAVIPADIASKNRGFISRMVSGKLPGFNKGTADVGNTGSNRPAGSTINTKAGIFTLNYGLTEAQKAEIERSVNRLHASDPHAAKLAMLDFVSAKSTQAPVTEFTKRAVLWNNALNQNSAAETLNKMFPSVDESGVRNKEYGKFKEKFRSDMRGNPTKGLTIPDTVLKNPQFQKEFDMAKGMAKAHFEAIVNSTGEDRAYWQQEVVDKQKEKDNKYKQQLTEWEQSGQRGPKPVARKITIEDIARNHSGYDPKNTKTYHGTERGHMASVGAWKLQPEFWGKDYFGIDPRIENNVLSTLSSEFESEAGGPRAKIFKDAAANVMAKNPALKADIQALQAQIADNASFNEKERIAFSKVIEEISNNTPHYTAGLSVQEVSKLQKFLSYSKLLHAGYSKAELTSPKNAQYRANDMKVTNAAIERDALANKSAMMLAMRRAGISRIVRVLGFKDGVVSVPGPKGAGDVVPAMLSPGESVIPAGMSKKYAPLISGMVDGTLPGYARGKKGFNFSSPNDVFSSPTTIPGVTPPPAYRPEQQGTKMAAGFGSKIKGMGQDLGNKFQGVVTPKLKSAASAAGTGILKAGDSAVRAWNSQNGQAIRANLKRVGGDYATNALTRFSSRLPGNNSQIVTNPRTGKIYLGGMSNRRTEKAAAAAGYGIDSKGRFTTISEKTGKPIIAKDQAAAGAATRQTGKQMSAQASGRMAQAGMGLTMAVGMASAMPGAVGDAARSAIGPIAAFTAATSMIPGPAGLAVGAIGAVGMVLFQMKQDLDNFRAGAMKTAKDLSSGAEAMKNLGMASGKVTPTEVMDKIRADERSPYNIKTGKNTFGGSYVESEAGKALVSSVQQSNIMFGKQTSVSDVAAQLSQAVATNVLTKEQAASIAYNLGETLKDYDFGISVLTTMTKILGPNGEDLSKDPIKIMGEIITTKQTALGTTTDTQSTKGLISSSDNLTLFGRANYTQVAAAEAKYAQGFQDILSMGQQNLDNLELEHRKRLEILQAAGDLEGVNKENDKYNTDRLALQNQTATAMKTEYDYIKGLSSYRAGAAQNASANQIVDNIQESKRLMFEGMSDPIKNVAKTTLEGVADSNFLTNQTKATLLANVSVENIDQLQRLEGIFDPQHHSEVYEKIASIGIKYGPGAQQQMVELGSLFGSDDAAKNKFTNFTAKIEANTDGKSQETMDTLSEIKRVSDGLGNGQSIDMNQLIKDDGTPSEKLNKIKNGIKAVGDAITKNKGKKIKYEVIAQTSGMNLAQDQIDYFNSLPPDQQKVYTTTFLTIQETVTADQLSAWTARKIADAGGGASVREYWSNMDSGKKRDLYASEMAQQRTEALTPGDAKLPGAGGDVGGGAKADPYADIMKKLKQVRQAAVDAAGGFKELHKWMKMGALEKKGGGLLYNGIEQQLGNKGYNKDFIDFISNADKSVQDKFMTINKKTGLITMKKDAADLQNAFNAITLGNYQLSVQAAVKSTKDELGARKELLATGMSYKDAVEAGKDSGLAEAIAAIKASTDIKDKNAAIKQTIELYKQQKQAVEDAKTAEEKFNDSMSKINAKFDADRNKIDIDFKKATQADNAIVSAAQNDIDKIKYQIDDYQAGLTELQTQEDAVNKKYDERKDALDKIRDINQKISAQQKQQLTLADALSQGDIAAAARAAQEMRAQSTQDAMDMQQKQLDEARKTELANLKVKVGDKEMTRLEIEDKVKSLEKEIFDIEEKRLEPAQERIRLVTVEKDLKLAALDAEKLKWDELQNKIDLAKTSATDYAAELAKANALAAQAVTDYTVPKKEEVVPPPVSKDDANELLKFANIAASYGLNNLAVDARAKASLAKAAGGIIPKYLADGGQAIGTDTIPAMLTPGEFIVTKSAVDKFGVNNLKSINNGTYAGNSMYNYEVNVNVKSDANPDQIARVVIGQIKQIDSQSIRRSSIYGN